MKQKQSLSKQAILYLSGDLILQTVSVVAGLVFARLLTPESYGVYSVYMAWVAIISAVLLLRSDGTLQIVMNRKGVAMLCIQCNYTWGVKLYLNCCPLYYSESDYTNRFFRNWNNSCTIVIYSFLWNGNAFIYIGEICHSTEST